MKLIIEHNADGQIYVYRESERQFRRLARDPATFVSAAALDEECHLRSVLPRSRRIVCELKPGSWPRRLRRKSS